MPTLRLYKASLTSTAPKLRVYKAQLTGSATTFPKLRVYKVSATGSVAAGFNPFPDRTVEPMEVVSITAIPLPGSPTIDTYAWRQVSGTSVTLSGTGATRTFTAPSVMPPGTTIVLGVQGTASGVTGPERLMTLTVVPQMIWTWNGTAWVGGGKQLL